MLTAIEALPDLLRTEQALAAYDRADAALQATLQSLNMRQIEAEFEILEALDEKVGEAFGLDTIDRNSVETCRRCVRAGHKVPAPGSTLSFVRRMVRQWRAKL